MPRAISLSVFFLLLLCACKKETVSEYELVPTADGNIILRIEPQPDKSKADLVWTAYSGKDFKEYHVTRSIVLLEGDKFSTRNELVAQVSAASEHRFTDDIPENAVFVSYHIVLFMEDWRSSISNSVEAEGVGKYQQGVFSDVLINTDEKLLYFLHTETGMIKVQSYDNMAVVAEDTLYTKIGYSTLGYFGNQQELYVPTNDGWIIIYDAATLARKDRIFVGGQNIRSVAAADGKLIVSANDQWEHPDNLKIYDRQDKSLIARTGFYKDTRLVHLKNSNPSTFVGITLNVLPERLSYHQLNPDGTIKNTRLNQSWNSYALDGNILRSFPRGNRFITSAEGAVYGNDLTYEKSLPTQRHPFGGNNTYYDYAFNEDGSVIYAAVMNEPEIRAIRYADLSKERSFQTTHPPYRLFRDGNQLIAISMIGSQFVYPSRIYYLIEKFDL